MAFSMAFYHKRVIKNNFAYVLQFFSLISDSLGSVCIYDYIVGGSEKVQQDAGVI